MPRTVEIPDELANRIETALVHHHEGITFNTLANDLIEGGLLLLEYKLKEQNIDVTIDPTLPQDMIEIDDGSGNKLRLQTIPDPDDSEKVVLIDPKTQVRYRFVHDPESGYSVYRCDDSSSPEMAASSDSTTG